MNAALRAAFLEQAGHCEGLDSRFMGRLLRLLGDHWPEDTELGQKSAEFTGDIGPSGHSLPLRIAGGLHALVLLGKDPRLAGAYPPHTCSDDELVNAIVQAIKDNDGFLCDWIGNAPQTNEVRRSAVLIGAAQLLADRFGLPFRLSELGASAGLNLMFDRFRMNVGSGYGPDSTVSLSPEWKGPLPPLADICVAERRGVDLNPLDVRDDADALRLQAYLWADQKERIARTRAAIALQDAPLDKGDAIDWLATRLAAPAEGHIHLIYHTVAWQYFPADVQERGTRLITSAGSRATESAPLAWLSYEADNQAPGAALTLRIWPQNTTLSLGRADFHGRWVDWHAPATLR
ncbi:hypothetical protein BXY66_0797 [Shimia isoporae]|uniref:DUF2332 family protein n=1 Tax=Shimia isoporae TaxID=647720 RepID=A0A4R1NM03_9RHOB|nr:DUF2332 family protein [Shimia isoporae]TCL08759.1 hypothetical protein BXY66_0797 [Shimia isoporae]